MVSLCPYGIGSLLRGTHIFRYFSVHFTRVLHSLSPLQPPAVQRSSASWISSPCQLALHCAEGLVEPAMSMLIEGFAGCVGIAVLNDTLKLIVFQDERTALKSIHGTQLASRIRSANRLDD